MATRTPARKGHVYDITTTIGVVFWLAVFLLVLSIFPAIIGIPVLIIGVFLHAQFRKFYPPMLPRCFGPRQP